MDQNVTDFVKRSKVETTRIDHKGAAESGDPSAEDQSAAQDVEDKAATNPSVLESADMAAGETRYFRDRIEQGQRFRLLSVGVLTDATAKVADLTASVYDETNGTVLFTTEELRVDGDPLVELDGPRTLRFELENGTGTTQTEVSGRWVYQAWALFSPDTWMFQVDPRNLGTPALTYPVRQSPGELWSVSTTNPVRSSAFVGDDRLYVGTDDDEVLALDFDGNESWSFATGGSVRTAPAVVNGVVYAGCDDNSVYALDANDGTGRWSKATGNTVRSSPAFADDVVYVGSDDNTVYALDAADGSEQWTVATGDSVRSSPAAVDGETVYVGSNDNTVYALDAADGSEQWTHGMGSPVHADPTAALDRVYVAGGVDLVALTQADGTVDWSYTAPAEIVVAPAIVDGVCYVGTQQAGGAGELIAIDAIQGAPSGPAWRTDVGGPGLMSAPTVLGGLVIVGWRDGTVRAYDAASGTEAWSYDTGASDIQTSPAIRDGTIYVGVDG